MGKAKRNRVKSKTSNPTGIPSVRDIEREEDEFGADGEGNHMSKQESTIQTLLEMLQSPNIEEKVIGLQTLATAFDVPESIEDVMKHKVVKVAAPLLFDKSTAVRNAAAGALRNLSACGSHEICDLLVEQDVMTPLSALIQKYAEDWQPSKKKSEDKIDEVADTFTQAVHLLWNLCESNGTAVKYFNSGNLLPVLVKCLEVGVFGVDIAIAVAQCLHTVTEDNPAAVSKLQGSSPALQKLLDLEDCEPAFLLLRTLTCGLILNLNYGKVSSLSPTIVTQIMCSLTTTLTVNHRKILNDFTSSMPLDEAVEISKKHTEMLKCITNIQYLIEAQKIAIELLANVCSGDDADDDAMDQDSSGNSSDDVLSDSGLPEDDSVSPSEKFSLCVPSEVHEAVLSGQLVEKVWDKTQLPAENVCQILKEHDDGKCVFNKLCTLRCHALLCMNNLLAGLDIQDLNGPNNVYQLWLNIGTLIFKQTDLTDTRFLEAATTALRASLQKLAEAQCNNLFGQLTESDLQLMFDTEIKCPDENVRANLIRSIGMLGMILTKSIDSNNHALTLLKNIGKFLLEVCVRETELWVVAEAVDSIMDVFGEDETDLAAVQINLVEKLQALLPALKSKVRLQRKSLGDHYLVVTTVNTNLGRFIKYKSKRVSLIGQINGYCK
ncbi:HEAT repeat-containing protein 3 [Periplaneta americana]|uniref:HEAT repeat-containing protein 3 n=1 Tax=Periplaneta americana TaxID=6978 RepID=UPI0037E8EAF2